MNTDQLYEMIWSDAVTSSSVDAVIACNALKYIREPRGCYIVNINENSYLRGQVGHWVFLRIAHSAYSKTVGAEIFDAMGSVSYNKDVNNFINRFNIDRVNKHYISNVNCGIYVLVYAYYRCRHFSSDCILNILNGVSCIEEHCKLLYGTDKRGKRIKQEMLNQLTYY